jgi:hypothetical protein
MAATRSVVDLYNFMAYVVRKERGQYLTIPDAQQALNTGQIDAVEEWFAGYGVDQKLHDALRPLRVYQPFTSTPAGFVNFPANYMHLLGNPFTVAGSTVNPITFVNEDELPLALTSALRPVDNSNPIAVDSATGFSIFPQSEQTGGYYYLRNPTQCDISYTQVGRTITFSVGNSINLDFGEGYLNNVIAKALRYVGINMAEQEVSQFANQYNQETK